MARAGNGRGRRPGRYQQATRVLLLLDELAARRRGMALRELADELQVTERQIRRDLAAIELAGYPVQPVLIEHRAGVRLTDLGRGALARQAMQGVAARHRQVLETLRAAIAECRQLRYRLDGREGVLAPLALVIASQRLYVLGQPLADGVSLRLGRLPDDEATELIALDELEHVERLARSRFSPPAQLPAWR
jgi:hypothetical protein